MGRIQDLNQIERNMLTVELPAPAPLELQNLITRLKVYLSSHVLPYGWKVEYLWEEAKFEITANISTYIDTVDRFGRTEVCRLFDPTVDGIDGSTMQDLRNWVRKLKEFETSDSQRFASRTKENTK